MVVLVIAILELVRQLLQDRVVAQQPESLLHKLVKIKARCTKMVAVVAQVVLVDLVVPEKMVSAVWATVMHKPAQLDWVI